MNIIFILLTLRVSDQEHSRNTSSALSSTFYKSDKICVFLFI